MGCGLRKACTLQPHIRSKLRQGQRVVAQRLKPPRVEPELRQKRHRPRVREARRRCAQPLAITSESERGAWKAVTAAAMAVMPRGSARAQVGRSAHPCVRHGHGATRVHGRRHRRERRVPRRTPLRTPSANPRDEPRTETRPASRRGRGGERVQDVDHREELGGVETRSLANRPRRRIFEHLAQHSLPMVRGFLERCRHRGRVGVPADVAADAMEFLADGAYGRAHVERDGLDGGGPGRWRRRPSKKGVERRKPRSAAPVSPSVVVALRAASGATAAAAAAPATSASSMATACTACTASTASAIIAHTAVM